MKRAVPSGAALCVSLLDDEADLYINFGDDNADIRTIPTAAPSEEPVKAAK